MNPLRARLLFCLTAAIVALPVTAMADDNKLPPACKMNQPDVHLTPDGWAGPDCLTSDGNGNPTPAALKAAQADMKKSGGSGDKAKPACKPGDPDVMMTNKGYAGPNCLEADFQGNLVKKP